MLAANPMVRHIFVLQLATLSLVLQPSAVDIDDPVSELPTLDQEADINNLDLLASREKYGHIDFNAATGNDIADLFGNGALASMIDASIMSDHETDRSITFPDNQPVTTTLSIPIHYDPSIHYPLDLFQKLFAGGFEDSGSLHDRFSAWKQLAALPALKTIPKQTFSTKHYKGEGPTDEMKCPVDDCGEDLMYVLPCLHTKSVSYMSVLQQQDCVSDMHPHTFLHATPIPDGRRQQDRWTIPSDRTKLSISLR
jgi:hypothetical protein